MVNVAVGKTAVRITGRETLTAGMANVVTCVFEFSSDWNSLSRTAVFSNGKTTIDVILDGEPCNVPHEVLSEPLRTVVVGVYGTDGDIVVLPTVWGVLGTVLPGADPSGDESVDPTLPVWQQILGQIGDLDDLTTTEKANLVAAINEAARTGSGGGGGTVEIDNHTIIYDESGALAVNTASEAAADNTLPITSAAVYTTVGNIDALLGAI